MVTTTTSIFLFVAFAIMTLSVFEAKGYPDDANKPMMNHKISEDAPSARKRMLEKLNDLRKRYAEEESDRIENAKVAKRGKTDDEWKEICEWNSKMRENDPGYLGLEECDALGYPK